MTAPGQVESDRWGGRVRVLETWFDEDPASREGYDLWSCHQRSSPVAEGRWLYFYTLHVDLSPDPETILANMRKNTARDIRAAEAKDGLTWTVLEAPTAADLEAFARFHDENPRAQGQLPAPRERLKALHDAGLVQLSQVQDRTGRVLVRHALLPFPRSGILQLNAMVSLRPEEGDKALAGAVGRANRWLFYQEFRHYRDRGFRTYDLNGWYAGLTDEKRLRINQFKEGFRGRILYGYDCEEPLTLKGRVYLALAALKRLLHPAQLSEIRRRRQKAPSLPED